MHVAPEVGGQAARFLATIRRTRGGSGLDAAFRGGQSERIPRAEVRFPTGARETVGTVAWRKVDLLERWGVLEAGLVWQ